MLSSLPRTPRGADAAPRPARRRPAGRAGLVGLAAAALGAAVLVALPGASPAVADTAPQPPASVPTVSADALPTVQINGIVYDQVIAGNRVYVTGEFTSARPAGSPAGTNETPRSNVLAFDLTTGELVSSWAPSLNAGGRAIVASADGSRVFVAGSFTQVNGVNRYRVAALDATTGALVPGWTPGTNARVSSLAISGDALYLGGIFTNVNNLSRTRLAAVSASTGALLGWAPTADAEVLALTAPAASGKVVAGGKFTQLNGVAWYGMGALDATTGAGVPWAATSVIRNAGANAGIYSLSTDGTRVFGTGYTFGSGGNFEATFSANASDGSLVHVSGCRGDTYDTAPVGGVLYSVGHAHDCGSIGGHPQTNPWTFQRATAETVTAAPSGMRNVSGNFSGRPAPEILHWTPALDVGAYSGQDQAAWSVAANSAYVVLGGEFPRVNGTDQQGLVRFAVRDLAPNLEPPLGGLDLTPTYTNVASGAVRLNWPAAHDRDNRTITYDVMRGATLSTSQVIGTVTYDSAWWNRPTIGFTDTNPPGGENATYRIRARDPLGNVTQGLPSSVDVPAATPAQGEYGDLVVGDGARHFWRLGEPSGATGYDWATGRDLTLPASATRNVAGAIVDDADRAMTFNGVSSTQAYTPLRQWAPQVFTLEAWFRTTTTRGGKIIGYGSSATGTSSTYDRHVYLTDNGAVAFGVYDGAVAQTIASGTGLNDGQWHHVAASFGPGGTALYVDGGPVAANPAATTAIPFNGYWRIGSDQLNNWPGRPTSNAFAGSIDDVAVYPTVLSAEKIATHRAVGLGAVINEPPTASFTTSVDDLDVSADASGSSDADGTIASYGWSWGDGTTSAGATASHAYAASGTYTVTLTVTDDGGVTGTETAQVTVVANQPPTASFTTATANLVASVDAGGSADVDGTIASYGWSWGDGATSAGATASHAYAGGGTYTVTLTVTDDDGATVTATRDVTVAPPAAGATVASDGFGRSVASGFGVADLGGVWSTSGSGTGSSVGDGAARVSVPAGRTASGLLGATPVGDTEVSYEVWAEAMPTGGGVYTSSVVRSSASGEYRVKVRIQAGGVMSAQVTKVVAGTETALTSQVTVPGTYSAGARLNLRVQATGSSPTTVRYRAWLAGTAEPGGWLQTTTDSTSGLQGTGVVGFVSYASGSATAPAVLRYDTLTAKAL
jgi:PKD repeat protein